MEWWKLILLIAAIAFIVKWIVNNAVAEIKRSIQ